MIGEMKAIALLLAAVAAWQVPGYFFPHRLRLDCPSEACVLGRWIACADTPVRERPGTSQWVVGQFAKGSRFPVVGAELLKLDDPAFRARFRGTPIKRTGRDRFLRNVLIAAGNSGDETLVPQVEERLSDASPLVRAMAVWALSRLVPDWAAAVRESEAPGEADPAVADEWARIGA
jgi:hypothetical protein